MTRNCAQCGKRIQGRADKRFCDSVCRKRNYTAVTAKCELVFREVTEKLGAQSTLRRQPYNTKSGNPWSKK